MNNYVIYKITSPSGKFYIGLTNSFKRRMQEHLSDWKNRPEKIALHNSFTKYGFDNHKKEIIYSDLTKDEAYNLEKELVEYYNTTNSKIGLNSREGGKGGNVVDWKSKYGKEIIEKANKKKLEIYNKEWIEYHNIILQMKDNFTIDEICKKIGKSSSSLCFYLKRNNIKIPRKPKFNLKEIAMYIKPFYEKNYTNKMVIEMTGYSKGTICRAKNILFQLEQLDNEAE